MTVDEQSGDAGDRSTTNGPMCIRCSEFYTPNGTYKGHYCPTCREQPLAPASTPTSVRRSGRPRGGSARRAAVGDGDDSRGTGLDRSDGVATPTRARVAAVPAVSYSQYT